MLLTYLPWLRKMRSLLGILQESFKILLHDVIFHGYLEKIWHDSYLKRIPCKLDQRSHFIRGMDCILAYHVKLTMRQFEIEQKIDSTR